MQRLFDSHAHINNETYTADERAALIREIESSAVTRVMDIGFDLASSRLAAEHAARLAWCYAAVGVHPHEAKTWTDETVTALVKDEKKAEQKKSGRSYSKTENVTPPSVSTSIDVPQIEPFTQVTVRNRLQSDRCFLLIGDVKSSATNCSVIAAASKERVSPVSTNNKGGNCDGLFKFVSPTDPEYYREFKPVSYEEDKALSENKRAQDRRDINTQYDAAVTEINKVSKVFHQFTF